MATATKEYGLFIDGETVEPAGALRDIHEPATGEVLASAAMKGMRPTNPFGL